MLTRRHAPAPAAAAPQAEALHGELQTTRAALVHARARHGVRTMALDEFLRSQRRRGELLTARAALLAWRCQAARQV
jgi:hypothetical protein